MNHIDKIVQLAEKIQKLKSKNRLADPLVDDLVKIILNTAKREIIVSEWVTAKEIADNFGFSVKHLNKLRASKTLCQGLHYKVISSKKAMRATYRYNIRTIAIFLSQNK
jgi:hypothetical protein